MGRHDEAMELLTKEKDEWYEKTVEKKNRVALLRQEVEDANKDFRDTNEALRKLRLAKEDLENHEDIEPKLENYYEPSDEMKMYNERRYWRRGIGIRILGHEITILTFS